MSHDSTDAPFIVIGGGMAGDAAARGIRMVEDDHPVLLLTSEPHPPYDRPPLSKDPFSGELAERVDRATAAEGIQVRTGCRVREIDRDRATLTLEDGERISWRGLVLAPGARPLVPDWARTAREEGLPVVAFRTLEDARALQEAVEGGARPLVVGGGFIGTEIAAALATHGCSPTLLHPEEAPLGRVLPPPFPTLMTRHLEAMGTTLVTGTALSTASGLASAARSAAGDHPPLVVLGLGVAPRVELARGAGLQVGPPEAPGIEVDGQLATSDPRIRAAGDAIRYPCPFLGGDRIRTEHEDHANESGVMAGCGVAGEPRTHAPIPVFHSSVGSLVWEGIGRIEPEGAGLQVEAGSDPGTPGAALFRRDSRLEGVVVWNRPGRVPRLRRLLADPTSGDLDPADVEALERRVLEVVLDG